MNDIVLSSNVVYENTTIDCDTFAIQEGVVLSVKGTVLIHCKNAFIMMNNACIQGVPDTSLEQSDEALAAYRNAKTFSRAMGGKGGVTDQDGQRGGRSIAGQLGGKGGYKGASIQIVSNLMKMQKHTMIEMSGENGESGHDDFEFGAGGGGGGGGGRIVIESWFLDGHQGTLIANGGTGGSGGKARKSGENGHGGDGGEISVTLSARATASRYFANGGSGFSNGLYGAISINSIPDHYRTLSCNQDISVLWTSPETLLCFVKKNGNTVSKVHLKNVSFSLSDAKIEKKIMEATDATA